MAGLAWIFIAKLADPLFALFVVVPVWFWGRSWLSVLSICVAAAFAQEAVLTAQQYTRTLNPVVLLLAILVAVVWAAATVAVRRKIRPA